MTENVNAETIGSRAKEVRDEFDLQQQVIAEKMGISLRAWQKMERDEGTPSGETLLNFKKLGINPGWVLTGLGPKRLALWLNADAEAELLIRISRVVEHAHEALAISLPERALAKTTRAIFLEVTEALDPQAGPDEVDAMLAGQAAKLRRRLSEALAKPGTGKRSAS